METVGGDRTEELCSRNLEVVQTALGARCHCCVAHKGQGHHHRLFPYTPAPASASTGRGFQQGESPPA